MFPIHLQGRVVSMDLKLHKIKWFAQDHTAGKWQGKDSLRVLA